jgi:UDP-N-acetylmuramoyl-tripeptide--D-alanyl-D-alanine ligase
LSEETAKGASAAKVLHFKEKVEFFAVAKECLQKGDTVLVKASHGMAFSEIVEKLKELKL